MNFNLSRIILIAAIALGLELVPAAAAADNYAAGTIINAEEEESKIIKQFFNYVDVIVNIKLDNMLKLTQDFAERLLDSIPLGDRGNTAELLHQYRVNAQRLRDQGGSIEDKENLLMELQHLIATIKSGLAIQEKEDIILRRGLLGMFELLARLSIEERKCSNKFTKAATLLRRRFSAQGIERHQELFDLLTELNNENDIVAREKLFARFKALKKQDQ